MSVGGRAGRGARAEALDPDLCLPASLLVRYLFFLGRRPISASNRHFLAERAAGLRSLAGLLAGRSNPLLDRVAAQVRGLTPASLGRVAHEVVAALTPLVPRQAADDVIVSHRPPDAELLGSARRIRLVLGPGIGIGDEVIGLPLPSWLRAAASAAEVHVLSTRPELWRAADGVADVRPYADHAELVRALRGDGFDLVLLADFEKPALAPSLTREPAALRYVELSLGARALSAFDGRSRRLHELSCPAPYFHNYYEFAAHALAWLGAGPRPRAPARAWTEPARAPGGQRFTLVVSPFTSKYEPSEAAWSELLGALLPAECAGAARLVLDPGPNLATERFAVALARSTRARAAPGVECEVAHEEGARTLTLSGALRLLRRAQVVVCADTFAAHAAPLFGCTTLVVAGEALENWRVPRAPVFYFDDDGPPEPVARGMRRVLAALDGRLAERTAARPWRTPAGERAAAATLRLAAALTQAAEGPAAQVAAYEECAAALREVVAELPDWPRDFAALLADRAYHRLLPPLRSARILAARAESAADLAVHLSHLLGRWENSNLYKYLTMAGRAEAR